MNMYIRTRLKIFHRALETLISTLSISIVNTCLMWNDRITKLLESNNLLSNMVTSLG